MATLEKHVKRGKISTKGKSDDKNTLKGGRDGATEPMKGKMDYSGKKDCK